MNRQNLERLWGETLRSEQPELAQFNRLAKGITYLRAAVAKEATGTLGKGDRAKALSKLGYAYLEKEKSGPSTEARDALKEAVGAVADLDSEEATIARYNLACAHARLKEIDDAFKNLTTMLEENAKDPSNGSLKWQDDVDFTNLKADPRWAALAKKYPQTEHGHGGGDGGGN